MLGLQKLRGFISRHRSPVFEVHGLLRRAGPLCLAFLMVACASQDSSAPVGYDEARAERLFTASYQDVSDIYIEDVAVADLAIAGMGSLASIDPAVDIEAEGKRLRVDIDGLQMASYPMPDSNDAQAWGALTAAVISASRYHSDDLQAADPERLYEAVFDGVLTQLDGFSRYAGRDAARENRASREGFGGIGVRIRLIEEGVLILSVMEDTPAEAAGLRQDDVIVAIDGDSVEGLSQHDVVNRLRGRTGSQVSLSIERDARTAVRSVAMVRTHLRPDPEIVRENRDIRKGLGSIGVRIRPIEEGAQVLSVIEGTPAESAGLRRNDVIVAIDGDSIEGLSRQDVMNRLSGRTGSQVSLSIERDAESAQLSVGVVRSHIVPQTVRYHREGNLAYIRLTGFNNRTVDGLRQKIRLAQQEIGDDLNGYILDLRGNPGGLLDQAVWVSDVFITGGRIVSTHGRHTDSHQYYAARNGDLTQDAPLVVLIDGSSASASEIVAAALQDSGRAVLVGSASFGKGSVQTVLKLPNQGEFILTWARFHAPSGYALHRRGVLPDICTTGEVSTSGDVLRLIGAGALPIAADLRRLDVDSNDDAAVEALRAHCPPREDEAEIDLQVARQLLEEPGLYARALHGQSNTAATGLSMGHGSGS